MTKPAMTQKDRKAMDDAFNEYRAAQEAMHQAFVQGKPPAETDKAITLWTEKRDAYHKMTGKFFQNYPQ